MRKNAFGELPETGFVRQSELIGQNEVTPEEAERNRAQGKGPKRPRPGKRGLIPFSSATLWRKIANGSFPAPVKLNERVTAFSVDSVRRWIEAQAAK
jgi:hypothetical protein